MREIKFRVWDNHAKRFLYDVAIFGGQVYVINYEESNFVPLYTKEQKEAYGIRDTDIIIEQYTGLHDKNGKEIYEGDIITWEYVSSVVELKEYKYLINNGYNSDSIIGWCATGGNSKYLDCPVNNDCEVIGSINENPELLEGVEK
jgi:uncharacterized phage protein (TIGR01671 family)